jgi:phosphoribosyl-ATP pyrophosphohydrolase/phosphoribosyl-AMP cyclohydrolase
MKIENIDWQKVDNLLPVIVQDVESNEVLMMAYMNQEALKLTIDTGFAHYFSRTKQRIWKKGESSNHTQEVKDMLIDCDNDTLLLKVIQSGVACHTGRKSCFFTSIKDNSEVIKKEVNLENTYSIVDTLFHIIESRKNSSKDTSYTASLFAKGENGILKKVVEEAGELTFAVKDSDTEEIIYECADLVYHVLVALSYKNINPDRVKQELKRRFGISGIEEKNSRG